MNRRSLAILKKQFFDIAYNKSILIQFLIYPLFTLVFLLAPITNSEQAKIKIVMLMSSMITGMSPIIIVSNIIQEDKRIGALRMLILSNVKSFEYLIGITLYILCISFFTSIIIGLIAGFCLLGLTCYVFSMTLCIIVTLFLGSAVACQTQNNASSSMFIVLISMMNGFIPVIATFYPTINIITRFWYTQIIADIIGDIYGGLYSNIPIRLLILIGNMLIFLAFFLISFKHNKLIDSK